MLRRAIIIAGPTGVGKTDLAVRLARRFNGELISCDSVQVYKHLEIGANKDRHEGVEQHLIDFVELDATFTAADFYESCFKTIENVFERGRVPILVGGTGFYMDWIVRGRPSAPATDPSTLELVNAEIDALSSWSDKLELLFAVDSDYAASLQANDLYRLKRALAVYKQTGRPLSSFRKSVPKEYDWRCFYLTSDRELLNRNIDLRCEKMIQKGLVQETSKLIDSGLLKKESSAGRSIGYQETIGFLESNRSVEAFKDYLKRFQAVTRQYSRRQECWFRNMSEFKWIERPSLGVPLGTSFVDDIVDWFNLPKDEFDSATSVADKATRAKYSPDARTNTKRMKRYSAKGELFPDDSSIEAFIEGLILDK